MSKVLMTIKGLILIWVCTNTLGALVADELSETANYGTIEQRKAQLLEWATINHQASSFFVSHAYSILGDTAVNGCKAEYSNYMVDFTNHLQDNQDFEIFVLPAIIRYLYLFGDCLSEQNIEVLHTYVTQGVACTNFGYTGHGTLNHAIIQASSWYLFAQYFSDSTWTNKLGEEHTSEALLEITYDNLSNRFRGHIERGHFEMASPNYSETNFFPLLNLIDFSTNSTIKSLAEAEAIKTLDYLKNHTFKGKLIPPLTRQASNELNGSIAGDSNLSHSLGRDKRFYWYYFGAELDLTVDDFRSHKASPLWIGYVLSDWTPEALYLEDAVDTTTDIKITEIPEFSSWGESAETEIFSQTYIGEHYAIGSANVRYRPYWFTGNIVEFGIVLESDNIFNQIDCTQPYWYSNTSKAIENDKKINWYDRSSPFMQTHIVDKNNLLFIAAIPNADPYTQFSNSFTSTRSENINALPQFVRCRVPRAFDNIIKNSHSLQINEGPSYIQITSLSQELEYTDDNEYLYFTLNGPKSALHFYINDQLESMEQLSENVANNVTSYSSENNEIQFGSNSQAPQIKMTYNNVLYLDSTSALAEREIMYESIPIIEVIE
ncbi:MAG: hypothetical protein ABJH06_16015 [Paraglaciecola sp.]|uniref:hypothetical protein n=1 Tax=Paraglaciecola sp. TaxID=1920173 RepID=UPI003298F074